MQLICLTWWKPQHEVQGNWGSARFVSAESKREIVKWFSGKETGKSQNQDSSPGLPDCKVLRELLHWINFHFPFLQYIFSFSSYSGQAGLFLLFKEISDVLFFKRVKDNKIQVMLGWLVLQNSDSQMLISFLKNAGPDSQGLGGDTPSKLWVLLLLLLVQDHTEQQGSGRLWSIFCFGAWMRLTELLNWVSTLRALAVHQTQWSSTRWKQNKVKIWNKVLIKRGFYGFWNSSKPREPQWPRKSGDSLLCSVI